MDWNCLLYQINRANSIIYCTNLPPKDPSTLLIVRLNLCNSLINLKRVYLQDNNLCLFIAQYVCSPFTEIQTVWEFYDSFSEDPIFMGNHFTSPIFSSFQRFFFFFFLNKTAHAQKMIRWTQFSILYPKLRFTLFRNRIAIKNILFYFINSFFLLLENLR